MAQIIAEQRDVEDAHPDVAAAERGDPRGQPTGQRRSPGGDTEQYGVGRPGQLLDDLMGDAVDRAGDVRRTEHGNGCLRPG